MRMIERFKRALLSTLIIASLMASVIPLLSVGNASAQSPVKVLIDLGHGEYMSKCTLMIQYVEDMGYVVETTDQPLDTPNLLNSIDILIVVLPFEIFKDTEKVAVYNFVNGGGSLLTASTWMASFGSGATASLNDLTYTQFGVTYSSDSASGTEYWEYGPLLKCPLDSTHPIATGVPFIYAQGPKLAVNASAQAIAWTIKDGNKNHVVLAAGEYGSGRCIFASSFTSLNDFIPTKEGEQFTWNVFKWLAGPPEDSYVGQPPTVHRDSLILGPGPSNVNPQNFQVLKGIIHIHTSESDGEAPPENVVNFLQAKDYDFAAITDHRYDTTNPRGGVSGSLDAKNWAQNHGFDIIIIPGSEAFTSTGMYHILALNVDVDVTYGNAEQAVIDIHNYAQANNKTALAILAHPTSKGLDHQATLPDANKVDGYEIVNSGISNLTWLGVDKPFIGGSDTHRDYDVKLDVAINYVFVQNRTEEDIMQAIKERRVVVYSITGYYIGDEIWINALGKLGTTPPGKNVQVTPTPEVNVTFSTVTVGGNTTATTSTAGPAPPTGYTIVGTAGQPIYYDITTTATYSGTITICVSYDETQVAGSEADLKLMQKVDGWNDITTSVDTVNNKIYGTTTSLSIFTVASPPAPVGGIAFPADKLALLAPYIILAALIAITAVSFVVYWRKRQ